MSHRSPRATYDRDMARLRGDTPDEDRRKDVVYGDDLDAEDRKLIETFILAHDPADPTVPTAGEKSYNTLARYAVNLMRVSGRTSLAEAGHDELNRLTRDLVTEGRSEATVRQTQMTLRSFYRYHDDLPADPDKINTFSRPTSTFDDRDMLTRDEIEAIEGELDHPRDLCIFHLLLYTGQRVGALRTLRVKDVAPEDGPTGRYWLNDDDGGLKGADENGGARPLLGARSAVRDWLKYHPDAKPDHYLITAKPRYNTVDATEPVTNELFRRMLKKARDEAGVDKPLHPHMLRHNFVTICKRDYDMPDETVKYLLGHSSSSTVMETTYSHLSAEDHIEKAEIATGDRDEPESRMSPPTCPTCGNTLSPGAKACERCGGVFTPDAVDAERQIQQHIGVERAMANGGELTDDVLELIANDDATLARLIELWAD